MTKKADRIQIGYLPFRDHTPQQLLGGRNVVSGMKIEDIDESLSDFIKVDIGDLQHAFFWEPETREMGEWSFVTPSNWHKTGPLPIRDIELNSDFRFKAYVPDIRLPNAPPPPPLQAGKYVRPVDDKNYPENYPGLILAASEETKEHLLFFPSFGDSLIAHHNKNNPPDFSSLVYDISGNKVDTDRKAGIHSAWWVKKITNTLNALAWNLTKSSGDDTGYGLYTASSGATVGVGQGSLQKVNPISILAHASHEHSGPFHPGSVSDKHFIQATIDGPLNAGHLDYNSYFYMNSSKDGPLDFEISPHPKSKEGKFPFQVHCRFDAGVPHQFFKGNRNGKWRWHVKIPIGYIIPPEKIPPIPPPKKPPGDPGKPRKPGDPSGPDGGGKRPPIPLPEGKDGPGGLVFPGGWNPKWGPFPTGDDFVRGPTENFVPPKGDFIRKPFSIAAINEKLMVPGLLIQAQPARTLEKFAKYNIDKTEEQIEKSQKKWPGVIQIEGYGKEKTPGIFTKIDGQVDRYPPGTGIGGLVVSPPETGMDDYDTGFAPSGIDNISDTYVTFLSAGKALGKTFLAFGSPDLNSGGIKNGFRIAMEDTDLYLRGIDNSGAIDTTKIANINVKTIYNAAWQYPSGGATTKAWISDASGNGSWGSIDLKRLDSNFEKMMHFWNGTILEVFDALLTSDGATITMSLEKAGGGDLTMMFSDDYTTLDTTPLATIVLSNGTDTVPVANYVYILQSTKVLTKNTTGWPAAEHIKIGFFFVQSATQVKNDGALINQNFNDDATDSNAQGHLTHITENIRLTLGGAHYHNGIEPTVVITANGAAPDNVDISYTTGVAFQLHRHSFSAFNSATGGVFFIVNDSATAYKKVTDLNGELTDSAGNSMTGKYFNLVVWGVGNKSGEFQPIMVNLPGGSYNKKSDATNDVNGYDVYSIPSSFLLESSTGILLSRFTFKHSNAAGGTWTLENTTDLRGQKDGNVAGGASGAGNVIGPASATDNAVARYDGVTGKVIQDSLVTIDDAGSMIIPGSTPDLTLQKTGADGNSGYTIWEGLETTFAGTSRRWKVREEITAGSRDHVLAWYGEDPTPGGDVKLMDFNFGGGVVFLRMFSDIQMTGNSIFSCAQIVGFGNLDLTAGVLSEVTVNEAGNDINFRAEGLTDSSLFFVDAGGDKVGVGTITPAQKLDVSGTVKSIAMLTSDIDGGSGNLNITANAGGEVVINDASEDVDFRVEGNTDANLLFCDAGNDKIGIGTSSPRTKLEIEDGTISVLTAEDPFNGERYIANANGPFLFLQKSRHATIGLQKIVQNGDSAGGILFTASDGVKFVRTAQIRAYIDGVPGLNDMPGGIDFSTTPNGGSIEISRMKIREDGGITVGSPIGGSKGSGTINAQAVYDDNVFLTCYPLESYFDGKVTSKEFIEQGVSPDYKIPALSEFERILKTSRKLPALPGKTEWDSEKKISVGKLICNLWEQIEHLSTYIIELNKRVSFLEE